MIGLRFVLSHTTWGRLAFKDSYCFLRTHQWTDEVDIDDILEHFDRKVFDRNGGSSHSCVLKEDVSGGSLNTCTE